MILDFFVLRGLEGLGFKRMSTLPLFIVTTQLGNSLVNSTNVHSDSGKVSRVLETPGPLILDMSYFSLSSRDNPNDNLFFSKKKIRLNLCLNNFGTVKYLHFNFFLCMCDADGYQLSGFLDLI